MSLISRKSSVNLATKLVEIVIFTSTSLVFCYLKVLDEKRHNLKCLPVKNEDNRSKKNEEYFTRDKKEDNLSLKEVYQPWSMTPSALSENKEGWVYVRGSLLGGRGSILWYRPGLNKISLDRHEAYFRVLLNGIHACITYSKKLSNGKNEKCNVLLDATSVGFSHIPSMEVTKKILILFESIFSDHLGVLILANMSAASQIFFKMVIPFLPKEVKRKIHILPSQAKKKRNMLKSLIQEEFIPSWLGGSDNYVFDAEKFYERGDYKSDSITEEEGLKYKEFL